MKEPMQPTQLARVNSSNNSKDLIYRQAALDAIHCSITVTGRQNAELVAATIGAFADRIKALPPAQPDYTYCANAMLAMWMDEVLTDGEYSHIMNKLNAHWAERRTDE